MKIYILIVILAIFLASCEPNDATLGGYLPGDWAKISAFNGATCGLRKDNKLFCWGSLVKDYQTLDSVKTPKKIDGTWVDVSVGSRFICGIKTNEKLYCWGKTEHGVLGDGIDPKSYSEYSAAPREVKGGHKWKTVKTYVNSVCGITDKNELYCWGIMMGDAPEPVFVTMEDTNKTMSWKSVFLGNTNYCAIDNNDDLYCWGNNENGELGVGDKAYKQFPTKVNGNQKWKSISFMGTRTFGITKEGYIFAWGGNTNDNGEPLVPTKSGEEKYLSFSSSAYHLCFIKQDKTLYCSGINRHGELGLGHISEYEDYTKLELENWKQVITAYDNMEGYSDNENLYKGYTCGIREKDGLDRIYCWGNNVSGQLTGKEELKKSPTLIEEW